METGELPLHLERTDLGELVRRFVQESQEELGPKGVVLTLKGAPAPHPLQADTEQLYRGAGQPHRQRHALRQGGAPELTLTVWRERAYERLRFADNGKGVPEEQLPHLFELFWRGDSARGSRNEGSGLGLYIVKHIIEAHGGTVSARNDGGAGLRELPSLRRRSERR